MVLKQRVLKLVGLVGALVGGVALCSNPIFRDPVMAAQQEASQYVGAKNRTAALFFDPKHQVELGGRVDPYDIFNCRY